MVVLTERGCAGRGPGAYLQYGLSMRLGMISDIHGNAVALDAVLKDLGSVAPDRVICLGDVAGWGPEPRRCIDRVADTEWGVVMGNSDAWMLDPRPFVEPTAEQRCIEEIDWWCLEQLSPAHLEVLRSYREKIEVDLDGFNVFCCHGSPRSFDEPMCSDTPEEAVGQMLKGIEASLVGAGHTHVPMLRRYCDIQLVNPGSVGMPYVRLPRGRVRNPAWAEYAVLQVDEGVVEVSLRRVPFDLDELRSTVLASGMPHAEAWLADRW